MQTLDAYCDLPQLFTPSEFRIKWADGAWERQQALRLRRDVFCAEQGIFEGDDFDAIDPVAQPIVAVAGVGCIGDAVVGCVRIHQAEPGLWWGSRLAVDAAFRRNVGLATTLIRLAVSSAHARGASVFLAHVQSQNLALFEHLNWRALKQETLHGRSHHLMQADLSSYPPCYDVMTGYVVRPKART